MNFNEDDLGEDLRFESRIGTKIMERVYAELSQEADHKISNGVVDIIFTRVWTGVHDKESVLRHRVMLKVYEFCTK